MTLLLRSRAIVAAASLGALLFAVSPAQAGSIFLTGHDPDFHSDQGGNASGARAINQTAIGYIMNSSFNPFASLPFLFVESTTIATPGGHVPGYLGLLDSGYSQGTNAGQFVRSGADTLSTALNGLGTLYGGIVVASDFGGLLTQAELDILNARSADIITFLNNGGGLYAMAESNGGAALTTGGNRFGFLPFIVSSTAFDQAESGNTLTAFGLSLGLTNADINGNFSHNIFTSTGGMNVVDIDAQGNILSLAVRSQITSTGVVSAVPEPSTFLLLGTGIATLVRRRRRAV